MSWANCTKYQSNTTNRIVIIVFLPLLQWIDIHSQMIRSFLLLHFTAKHILFLQNIYLSADSDWAENILNGMKWH